VTASLEWLGTATFRLTIGETVIFLDTYMDRVEAAPPIGLACADVTKADYILVGHSHFDHLGGADVIAKNTGARIIASNESCRVMRERGVPEGQLLPSQGGERHAITDAIRVRVFPSVHSCTWILTDAAADADEHGHTGLTQDERASQPGLMQRIFALGGTPEGQPLLAHLQSQAGSTSDGGPLVFLIETPDGAIFFQDSSGCWSGVLNEISADAAILAAAARPNVDGEPYQGSMAGFLAMEAQVLGARRVVIGHHDDWMPPVTNGDFDMEAVRRRMATDAPKAELFAPGYLEPVALP
jgi:L-ascorbate metabolism protein UlaG (beta-lactamase superfamily)